MCRPKSKIFFLGMLVFIGANLFAGATGRTTATGKSVASFSVASDEVLFFLTRAQKKDLPKEQGTRVAAWSKFVCSPGYSYLASAGYCKRYPHLFAVPKIGDEIETVLELKPTHAVLASFNRPIYRKILRKQGVKTTTLRSFGSLDDQWGHIKKVAKLLDAEDLGDKLVKKLKAKWVLGEPLLCDSKKPTVVILADDAKAPSAFGRKTLIHDYFVNAGFENLVATKLKKKGMIKLGPGTKKMLKPDFWVLPMPDNKSLSPASEGSTNLYVGRPIYAGSVFAASYSHGAWQGAVSANPRCSESGGQ